MRTLSSEVTEQCCPENALGLVLVRKADFLPRATSSVRGRVLWGKGPQREGRARGLVLCPVGRQDSAQPRPLLCCVTSDAALTHSVPRSLGSPGPLRRCGAGSYEAHTGPRRTESLRLLTPVPGVDADQESGPRGRPFSLCTWAPGAGGIHAAGRLPVSGFLPVVPCCLATAFS